MVVGRQKPPVWGTYNGQVKTLRSQGLTLQAIGNRVGVTRERVRQILKKHYGTTKIPGLIYRDRLSKLLGCSADWLAGLEKQGGLNPIHIGKHYLYDRDEAEKAMLAVQKERQKEYWITLVCPECGKVFERERRYIIYRTRKGQKHWFCSRQCLGKFVGRNYGFTAHPENVPKGAERQRKWDYEQVYKLREQMGWSSVRIGKTLGIPEGTVYMILRKRFGSPLPRMKRTKALVWHLTPLVEKECIGCGAIHTRRSLFCSVKCRDRVRALVRYYEGKHLGRGKSLVYCLVCGNEVWRENGNHRHFCDECLREYRRQVGERLKQRGGGSESGGCS